MDTTDLKRRNTVAIIGGIVATAVCVACHSLFGLRLYFSLPLSITVAFIAAQAYLRFRRPVARVGVVEMTSDVPPSGAQAIPGPMANTQSEIISAPEMPHPRSIRIIR